MLPGEKAEHHNLSLEVFCIVCILVNGWFLPCSATSGEGVGAKILGFFFLD
jgi:hypothetical protein